MFYVFLLEPFVYGVPCDLAKLVYISLAYFCCALFGFGGGNYPWAVSVFRGVCGLPNGITNAGGKENANGNQ